MVCYFKGCIFDEYLISALSMTQKYKTGVDLIAVISKTLILKQLFCSEKGISCNEI